jgi:periplasmic protein TonB
MEPSVPPEPPLSRLRFEPSTVEPPLRRRSLAASALFHAAMLGVLVGLWRSAPPPEDLPIQVTMVREGPGAAGRAGGAAGGGAAPETTQAAAQPAPMPPPETHPPTPDQGPAPPRRKPRRAKPAARPSPAVAEPRVAAAAPQPAAGRPGAGGGPAAGLGAGQGATGQGEGAVGDAAAGSPGDDYLERVRRWIQKFQHYPQEASRRKQQGTALLDVTLARDGTVLGVRVERSSGFPLLDEAAIKAVFDASPVPPFPESYRRQEGTMVLPAQYSLGFFERLF